MRSFHLKPTVAIIVYHNSTTSNEIEKTVGFMFESLVTESVIKHNSIAVNNPMVSLCYKLFIQLEIFWNESYCTTRR